MDRKLKDSLRKLVRIIRQSKRITVATHIDPDADGICAAISCGYLVKHYKGRRPTFFCHSSIPAKYSFLLRGWRFTKKLRAFDLLIAVDSAGISRIFPKVDTCRSSILSSGSIVNIDHHKSNDAFGMVKIIREDVSSACEIIYDIFRHLRIKINKHLADIFYSGIYSETGGFMYPNTTEECLSIVADLISCGIQPGVIVKKLNAKTLSGTLLLSKVLQTIDIESGVGVMYLSQKMLENSHAKMTDSENFVSFLQAIRNVRVSIFLREEQSCTRVSLRSDGVVDVDRIAQRYGGGGHRLAAGVRIKEDMQRVARELRKIIIKEIRKKNKKS